MKKVYVVGDSISMQYGPYLERYLDGVMGYSRKEGDEEARLNLDEPRGANGGDSGRVLSFLRAKAEAGGVDADLLLVNCGLHDIKVEPGSGARQVPIEKYRENLEGIVAVAERMECPLVWIRTTPCDENIHNRRGVGVHRFAADCEAYNRVADEVMAAMGVPTIDLYRFTVNLGEDLYCDHVHFNEPVREKQAAFIAGWLREWVRAREAMEQLYEEVIERFPEMRSRLNDWERGQPYLVLAYLSYWLQELQPAEITEELIGKVVDLSDWCREQPRTKSAEDDMLTIWVVAFFEHLFDDKKTRSLIPRLETSENLIVNAEYLKAWVGEENYELALREFDA